MTSEVNVNVVEDLVPIGRLGAGSKYVRRVVDTGRPKVITQGGIGVAVIVDVATYEALTAESAARELLRDLEAALGEADGGKLVEHERVMAGARARLAGRASGRTMRQLEAP